MFLVITLAVVVLVVLRYFFLTTIVGGQEFTVFCFIYTSPSSGRAAVQGTTSPFRYWWTACRREPGAGCAASTTSRWRC